MQYMVTLFDLLVLDRLEPPEFIEVPESQEILKGTLASFACKARGKPTPKINWYKDGKKISRLERLLSLLNRDDPEKLEAQSEMKLTNAVPLINDGVYTVEAINEAGSVKHEVNLVGKDFMICT